MKKSFNQARANICSLLLFLCMFSTVFAQTSKILSVKAGSLSATIGDLRATTTNLTVNGTLDARDIAFMRDSMPALAVVDMQSVSIMAYNGLGGTCSYTYPYKANEMPSWSFFFKKKYTGSKTLRSIVLPNTITSIGDNAFQSCSALTAISIPNLVQTIGQEAFIGCGALTLVTFGNGVTSLGDRVFTDCKSLTNITIPASVTTLGSGVFAGTSALTSMTVDANNAYFSATNGVLFNKDQTTLIYYPGGKQGAYTVPNTVTTIRYGAFFGCNKLTEVNIPESVSLIEGEAFSNCSALTSIKLPEGLDELGSTAFSYCTALKSVSIPRTISTIGAGAFQYCTALTNLKVLSAIPVNINLPYRVFQNVNFATCELQVPANAVSQYKAAPFWSDFRNIVEIKQ